MMVALAGERGTELKDIDPKENIWKEKMAERDMRTWSSWPRTLRTACPRPGTPWTTRAAWGDGGRTRIDYCLGSAWATSSGWPRLQGCETVATDHACMIIRWTWPSAAMLPVGARPRPPAGWHSCQAWREGARRCEPRAQGLAEDAPEAVEAWSAIARGEFGTTEERIVGRGAESAESSHDSHVARARYKCGVCCVQA